MGKYYVYTLAYPDGRVFYVGKGSSNRVHMHEIEAKRGYHAKRHEIIRSIWENGGEVLKQIVFETNNERDACTRELEVIREYSESITNIQHNTRVNPVIRRPSPPRVKVDQKALAVERGLWMNRIQVANYPEDQQAELLAKWDERVRRRMDILFASRSVYAK